MSDEELASAEVKRAVVEVRTALSAMAQREALAYPLMGICALIDRVEVGVTAEDGADAFVLDEENSKVSFRVAAISQVLEETHRFAGEVGYSDAPERLRLAQKAVNQFVVHELIHIKQKLPHLGSVQTVKQGLPELGMPILDATADVVSAWTCANVECERLETREPNEVLAAYVNALLLAYLVGAFVFDVRGRPPKTQRALGLVISALLVQALVEGTLERTAIFEGWRETSPVLVFNLENANVFNALVLDGMAGLLVPNLLPLRDNLAGRFWASVGLSPVSNTLHLGAVILGELGIIRSTGTR